MSTVILDPREFALADRAELDLDSDGIRIDQEGVDWGDAEIVAFMAEMGYGEAMVDYRLPNRKITIPLIVEAGGAVTFDDARVLLQAKASRYNEEGGPLKRVLRSGRYVFADVTSAKLHLGGDWFEANRDVDREAYLEFDALPDFYEEAVTLTAPRNSAGAELDWTEQIRGNLPGRVDLEVQEIDGTDQMALAHAFRCRHYSAEASADWKYEAEALQPLGAAEVVTFSGASPGGASNVVRHENLGATWTPVLGMRIGGTTDLTHTGLYDVWVRAYTIDTTPPPWLRLLFGIGDLIDPVALDQVQIPLANGFYLVNLGQIDLRPPSIGIHRWQGVIQARGASGGENVYLDKIWFLNGDESSGIARGRVPKDPGSVSLTMRDEFNQTAGDLGGKVLAATGGVEGPNSPGTMDGDDGGGDPWTNPDNAKASDNSRTINTNRASFTDPLVATNFGFSIPAGSTITGIKVDIERRYGGVGNVIDTDIQIVKGGVMKAASDKSTNMIWPAADTYVSFGGLGDLWSETWAYTDINDAGFGVAFGAFIQDDTQAEVDHIRITVYYDDASGQAWATTGDATDIAVEDTGHTAQRTQVSDADINTGRYAVAGSTVLTDTVVDLLCKRSASASGASEVVRGGVLARYTDVNNWLMAVFNWDNTSSPGTDTIKILKRQSGAVYELDSVAIPESFSWRRIRLYVDRGGRMVVWADLGGGEALTRVWAGWDSALVTGGALDDGKTGFYDAKTGATANTRNYDNFSVWIPSIDAVLFASQTARLTHREMLRKAPDGVAFGDIPIPIGDLPRIPVSGPERRPVQVCLKPSRGDFDTFADDAWDDGLGAELSYYPCWSYIPEELEA